MLISIRACRAGEGGNIGAGIGLADREGSERSAGSDLRKPAAFLILAAEQNDRTAAQALHGEGKIGKAIFVSHALADEAEASDVMPGLGHAEIQ